MIMLMAASSSSACSSTPPDLGEIGRQPFEDFGRGRDRIGGREANAAADGAERGRLVARHEPSLGGLRISAGQGAGRDRDRAPASYPALRPARLASMAACPLSASRFSISAEQTHARRARAACQRSRARSCWGARRGSPSPSPSSGLRRRARRRRRRRGGGSPPRGSLITRLCGPTSISAPKRWALSQSMPIRRSNWSGRHSIGCVGQAHQCGGFAAADLRTDGAREQALPAGGARPPRAGSFRPSARPRRRFRRTRPKCFVVSP